MRLRLWKRRVAVEAYGATITHLLAAETDTLRIALLTGALALTITDPNAKDGDFFNLVLTADTTQRVVTMAGDAVGTVTVPISKSMNVRFVYSEGVSKYVGAGAST